MKKTIRESNFELMRIISMFFIVLFHFIVPTGGNLINSTSGYTQMFFQFLSILIIVHVNSFILISGYFQYNKKIKYKKVFELLLMAWMYKVVIGFGYYYFSSETLYSLEILKILSPLELNNLWFLMIYLELFILSPYINILIERLDQKEHRKLLLILIIIFSIIPTITNQRMFKSSGFTLIHFVFIYILGAYLRKYPIKENIHFKNYSQRKRRWIFIVVFLFMAVFNFLLYRFSTENLLSSSDSLINDIGNLICRNTFYYQYPTIIIQSVAYFLIFETFTFKNRFINLISSSLFAIYIITETIYVRNKLYLYLGITKYNTIFSSSIIPKVFLYSIIIFIVCIIIELLRKVFIYIICKIYNKIFKTHKKI